MRVMLAFPYHPSPPSGGPNSVAYNTIEGLKKRHDRLESEGIEIVVMSSLGESPRPRRVSDPEYSQLSYAFYDPVKPHAVTGDLQSILRHRYLNGRTDLIHSHTLHDAVAGSLSGQDSLLTLHGIVWQEKDYVEGPYSRFKYWVKERRIGHLTQELDRIIAISPYVIEAVQSEFDVELGKFTFIENPISDHFFELPTQTDGNLVLCPGVISPRKNQLALVRALGRLKRDGQQFEAIFTGAVHDHDYYESVREATAEVGIRDNVEFLGNVSREELLDRFSQAGVVCLFSLQETAPMIVAEAMASGTPIVASDVGGVENMIRDGTDGYVVAPNDQAALADRLDRLLADENLRARLGSNARKEASRWRCERIADDLIDLYTEYGM